MECRCAVHPLLQRNLLVQTGHDEQLLRRPQERAKIMAKSRDAAEWVSDNFSFDAGWPGANNLAVPLQSDQSFVQPVRAAELTT